jgi:hypothetical protein
MQFTLDQDQLALNHITLENRDKAVEIASTELWKTREILEACLTINGVEIPAQIVEDWLQSQFEVLCKKAKENYDPENFDKRVEEKAKELLKLHADNALEKIYELQSRLEDVDSLLTPYWERN